MFHLSTLPLIWGTRKGARRDAPLHWWWALLGLVVGLRCGFPPAGIRMDMLWGTQRWTKGRVAGDARSGGSWDGHWWSAPEGRSTRVGCWVVKVLGLFDFGLRGEWEAVACQRKGKQWAQFGRAWTAKAGMTGSWITDTLRLQGAYRRGRRDRSAHGVFMAKVGTVADELISERCMGIAPMNHGSGVSGFGPWGSRTES